MEEKEQIEDRKADDFVMHYVKYYEGNIGIGWREYVRHIVIRYAWWVVYFGGKCF
jgi:hypothetical protein